MGYLIGAGSILFLVSTILSILAYRSHRKSLKEADNWRQSYDELAQAYYDLDENGVWFTQACIEIQHFFSFEENLDTPLDKIAEMSGYRIETVIAVCDILEDMNVIELPNRTRITRDEIDNLLDEVSNGQ